MAWAARIARPVAMAPRQQQRPVEPVANLLDQREGRGGPGVAAGPGGDGDNAVRAFLDGLAGVLVADDVVQGDAAVAVDGVIDLRPGARGC
jgi:hypothetical protein